MNVLWHFRVFISRLRWQWITNTTEWLARYDNWMSITSVISKYLFSIDYEEEGSYYCFTLCIFGLKYVVMGK